MAKESQKTREEKMEVIKRVNKDYLHFLFDGRDPFVAGMSVDEIYEKCLQALMAETLLSAG